MSENLTHQPFTVGGAIGFGWKRTWRNFWWLLLVSVIMFAINAGISLFTAGGDYGSLDLSSEAGLQDQLLSAGAVGFDLVGSVVQYLVTIFLALGVIRIALGVTQGERVQIGLLWSFKGFGRYLLGSIIVSLLIGIGLFIPLGAGFAITVAADQPAWVIIGGIIGVLIAIVLTIGFSLYGFAIVDQDAKGVSSLGVSWRLIRPRFGSFLGMAILIGLIAFATFFVAIILGILMLVLGILLTLPAAGVIIFGLTAFATAFAYRTLAGEPVA